MICTICYSEIKNTIMLHKCNHSFCSDCIHTWLDFKKSSGQIPSCPNCRKHFDISDFISVTDNTNPNTNTNSNANKYNTKRQRKVQEPQLEVNYDAMLQEVMDIDSCNDLS